MIHDEKEALDIIKCIAEIEYDYSNVDSIHLAAIEFLEKEKVLSRTFDPPV